MSTNSYEVQPITSNCKNMINNPKISSNPGTPSNQVSTNLDTMQAQQKENTRYDTVNMSGGKNKKKYIINASINNRSLSNKKNLKNIYDGVSDIDVIKKYKKDNKIKEDCFVYIGKNTYLIKNRSIRRI